MKLAEVIPLYKLKGKRELMNNNRPVSLLPFISKILEKLVQKRIMSFVQKKMLLYDSQFGFRCNHSTIDAILKFTGDVIKGFDRGDKTLGIFLDLSKAFDTLPHDTLLAKLENFGIRGKALQWFKSYLTDRNMYVNFIRDLTVLDTAWSVVHRGNLSYSNNSANFPIVFCLSSR